MQNQLQFTYLSVQIKTDVSLHKHNFLRRIKYVGKCCGKRVTTNPGICRQLSGTLIIDHLVTRMMPPRGMILQ